MDEVRTFIQKAQESYLKAKNIEGVAETSFMGALLQAMLEKISKNSSEPINLLDAAIRLFKSVKERVANTCQFAIAKCYFEKAKYLLDST